MRSKEVDEAIKRMEGVRDKNVHTFVDELTTVLAYIEELEQLPNKIIDKIKHCKNIKDVVDNGTYTFKEVEETIISVLKGLLGD